MAINLTEGAISKICDRELVGESQVKPIVQVMEIKLVKTPNNQNQNQAERQRYRMVLSDGTHMQQGMLATQHNHLVDSGQLQKGSIIQMNHFVCSPVKDRLIIVVVELEVIIATCSIIGNPVMFRVPGTEDARPSGIAASPQITPPLSNHVANAAPPYSNAPQQINGSYGGQNMGARSNLGQVSRPPGNLYSQQPQICQPPQPQPTYQQPQPTYRHQQPATYQPPRPSYQQQQLPPNYMNRGPIAKNEAAPRIIPIAALNPYQNRWTIKARVTSKGELRHYNNARGDGKVFSFDLLDSDGGEIRVTCFNVVADQFYNQIENGKVYLLSRGTLKPAQKNFNHLKNDHEIFLESTSVIQPCFEEDELIPRQQFHFIPICNVEEMESNSIVDLIGVVTSITPTSSIMRKNGTETQKRTLQLKDESARSVELTLWGNFCHEVGDSLQGLCDSGQFPILAVKAARVSEFNGKAVGSISSTQLFIDPNIQEASRLREWFEMEGKNAPCVSISREVTSNSRTDARKFVSQIKDEKLGTSEKPDWITISGTIQFIKLDNFCYTACPLMIGDRQCNKKVTDNGDGKWRCDRCDRVVDECDYRYIIQMQIMDHTGPTWVTAFQEAGEEIMGVSAKELFLLRTEEDDRFAEIMRKVLFNRYTLKLKVKEEIYSDEQRVKSTVTKAEKMNFSSESRYLLDLLNKKEGTAPTSALKTETATPSFAGNIRSMQQPPMTVSNPTMGGSVYSGGRGAYMSPAKQSGQFRGASYNNVQQLSCNSCGGSGHSSTNCPSIMQHSQLPAMGGSGAYSGRPASYGSGISSGAGGSNSGTCFKCHQSGHWARDCPGISSVPPAYGSTAAAAPQRYGGY